MTTIKRQNIHTNNTHSIYNAQTHTNTHTNTQTQTNTQTYSNIHNDITIFLQDNRKALNTRKSYQADIKEFFSFTRNKQINQLTHNDLQNYRHSEIMQYRDYLNQKHAKTTTVNRKIRSVKSLFNFLKANEYNVNPEIFNNITLKQNNTESHATLNWEEVQQVIQYILTENNLNARKPNPYRPKKEQAYHRIEKALFIELAVKTSIRKDALINLCWKDFRKENGVVAIKVIDKGEVHEKSIWTEFYERLEANLKTPQTTDNCKVFNYVSKKIIQIMMKDIINHFKWNNKNICFHSFKKAGINEVYLMSNKDILAMQKQGNHKDPKTTINYYMQRENDPSKYSSLLVGEDIDLEFIAQLNKRKILKAIHACDRGTQIALLSKCKELFANIEDTEDTEDIENPEDTENPKDII